MLSFLRTSRAIQKSHLNSNPTLRLYRIKLQPNRFQRFGIPVVGICVTGFLIYNNNYDSISRLISDKPIHIPVGFVQKLDPVPYKAGGPEVKTFRGFVQDAQRRVQAEGSVLNAVRKSVESSNVNIGDFDGFSRPFWMTFGLAQPPPQFSRKYLEVSLKSVEIVDRPVHPVNVARLAANLYPRALASSFYSFGYSLYDSVSSIFRPDETLGRYKPPSFPKAFSGGGSNSGGTSNNNISSKPDGGKTKDKELEKPLLPSNMVMAFSDALSDGIGTLEKEWFKDRVRSRPPPPRGWLIADGTIRIVGSELVLVVDFQAAVNPKNLEQCFVLDLKARHFHRRQRGSKFQTFQKPTAPPSPKSLPPAAS